MFIKFSLGPEVVSLSEDESFIKSGNSSHLKQIFNVVRSCPLFFLGRVTRELGEDRSSDIQLKVQPFIRHYAAQKGTKQVCGVYS